MGAARWCLGAELWMPKVKVHSSASCSSQHRLLLEDTPAAGAPPAEEPAAAAGVDEGQVKDEGEGEGEEHRSQQREVFTIWMKSLVLNGSGCTVFDSRGRIVYRVDNYGSHRSVDVCLMDITGSVVLQVLKKFRRWEGYRCGGWEEHERADAPRRRPWFTVVSNKWGRGPRCEFRSDGHAVRYKMDGGRRRQQAAHVSWIVDDATGLAVAEVKRKLTATGVSLGEDVLTLVVEPNVDHSLIMGLLVVHGLINHSM